MPGPFTINGMRPTMDTFRQDSEQCIKQIYDMTVQYVSHNALTRARKRENNNIRSRQLRASHSEHEAHVHSLMGGRERRG